MKKVLLIFTITALLFSMIACNADQDIGLLDQIALSQENVHLNLKKYLGTNNSEYYLLGDEGLYKNGDVIFKSGKDGRIDQAALNADGTITVLFNDGSYGTVSYSDSEEKYTLTKKEGKIYYLSLAGNKVDTSYSMVLECGENLLLVDTKSSVKFSCLIDALAFDLPALPIGFEKLGTDWIIVCNNQYIYKVSATGTIEALGKTDAFSSGSVTQIASFTDGSKVYFKASSTFIEASSTSISISKCAKTLATTDIVNIKAEGSEWIAATRNSGLYKIDSELNATRISF